jgi:hypothetical protein
VLALLSWYAARRLAAAARLAGWAAAASGMPAGLLLVLLVQASRA